MIELAQHIEHLLMYHDCVIVPGLGGFVAHGCSAQYVEDEGIFLPPYRSVTFNARLTMNDGLLVNEIAQQHCATYDEALKTIEMQVTEMRAQVTEHGTYELDGIGTLTASEGKYYEFTPTSCGITAPGMFGLDSICVSPLQSTAKSPSKVSIKKTEDDTLTMRVNIKVSAMRYAAVAAVAAVFYFICIAPLNSVIHNGPEEANMLQTLWSLILPQDSRDTDAATMDAATETTTKATVQSTLATSSDTKVRIDSQSESQADSQTRAQVDAQPETVSLPYTIVIASAIPEQGGRNMVTLWQREGHKDVYFHSNGHINRVIYGHYATETEARSALRTLRAEFTGFDEAWVMKVNN